MIISKILLQIPFKNNDINEYHRKDGLYFMISLSYINGSNMEIPAYDPFKVFESDLNDILDAVNTAYNEYHEAMNEYNLEVEFLESGDDVKLETAEEKKTNFVDKIGAAIIEVGKKAVAFINNIITKIQESLFANKSDMQKVSALCKKNPGMADEINKAFKEGNLQVTDLKSIKELESAYDEIMRLAKQENVDPNTLKGKWANAKKKFGNMSEADIIKGVTATIGVATAASVLVINLGKLPEAISNIKNFKQNAADKTELANLALEKARNDAEKSRVQLDEAKRQHAMSQKIDSARLDSERFKAKNAKDNEINKLNKQKAQIDLDEAKRRQSMNTKIDANKLSESKDRASKAADDAEISKMNKGLTASKLVGQIAKNVAGTTKESVEDLTFDDNGYLTESASDALKGVIATIHADMMKVYTTLANFNYKNIGKAKAIIAAAIRGYEKTPKTIDKKEDNEEETKDEE